MGVVINGQHELVGEDPASFVEGNAVFSCVCFFSFSVSHSNLIYQAPHGRHALSPALNDSDFFLCEVVQVVDQQVDAAEGGGYRAPAR